MGAFIGLIVAGLLNVFFAIVFAPPAWIVLWVGGSLGASLLVLGDVIERWLRG